MAKKEIKKLSSDLIGKLTKAKRKKLEHFKELDAVNHEYINSFVGKHIYKLH